MQITGFTLLLVRALMMTMDCSPHAALERDLASLVAWLYVIPKKDNPLGCYRVTSAMVLQPLQVTTVTMTNFRLTRNHVRGSSTAIHYTFPLSDFVCKQNNENINLKAVFVVMNRVRAYNSTKNYVLNEEDRSTLLSVCAINCFVFWNAILVEPDDRHFGLDLTG